MSIRSLAPSHAQIEYCREIPIVILSGRLDTSTIAAFAGAVAGLRPVRSRPWPLRYLKRQTSLRMLDIYPGRRYTLNGGRS